MARIAVVGGGLGGCASAARLAKLGHEVTVLERGDRLGGALGTVEQDGFAWDTGPGTTLLPAALRDLFRKSGRPLEREVDLVPLDPPRRHRLADGTWLELPSGGRAVQREALAETIGEAGADAWLAWTQTHGEAWEDLRTAWFERPWAPDLVDRRTKSLLFSRSMLHKAVAKAFADERLRSLATWQAALDGHDPRNVPAWMGVVDYLEQQLGVWTVPGGMGGLADVLTKRLAERRVTVLTSTPALDLEVREGRAAGVLTPAGTVEADQVVVAVDPRGLPALASYVRRTMPAIPPVVCHVGLQGEVPPLPPETVFHGDPMLVVRTGGRAPEGHHAWTVLGRGHLAEDVLAVLARHRVDVRDQVVTRVDRSPRAQVEQWGGSPAGVLWQGRGTLTHRLGTRTPIAGVWAAGAHATPGAGVPFVCLSAALVAQEVGPA